MEQFIGCDAHKEFSVFVSIDEKGVYGRTVRVGHDREVFRKFLGQLPAGSQIALETSGCYYWGPKGSVGAEGGPKGAEGVSLT
jgi:hypothetical protein